MWIYARKYVQIRLKMKGSSLRVIVLTPIIFILTLLQFICKLIHQILIVVDHCSASRPKLFEMNLVNIDSITVYSVLNH
jgi:hypothetical protein